MSSRCQLLAGARRRQVGRQAHKTGLSPPPIFESGGGGSGGVGRQVGRQAHKTGVGPVLVGPNVVSQVGITNAVSQLM